ncbi:hypothetical protein GGX14DRAFT_627744 [Mycena pura]|uniref:Metallo-beta-lactamase domain-containing protein n=1 Tax=Mycena pura TaxID=153505 RepID=A0AAD6YR79_9AGAR|nr:hypothetical protein GGX14DRAFT_627744 [Mycena pura]
MSFRDLNIPASSSTVTVTVFDIITDHAQVKAPASVILKPVLPGYESLKCPMFAFLVENNVTKTRVMFDLGPRKDLENAAPPVAEVAKAAIPVSKDIVEQLVESGVDIESINAVIWRHVSINRFPQKLDMVEHPTPGDMSKFPPSTHLVISKDLATETNDVNPQSTLLASDFTGHRLITLDFSDSSVEIGGLKAIDYFGDGSFYILDVPGHQAGHVCALARVAPTNFVLMGADACHHVGELRPTSQLHARFPCPGALAAATRVSVSYTHFPTSGPSPVFDLAARTTPLLSIPDGGVTDDLATAHESLRKLADFDANADVFIVIAHDESLLPVIGLFPASLDDWHAKGWKEAATWAFLDEKNPAFRFNVKSS